MLSWSQKLKNNKKVAVKKIFLAMAIFLLAFLILPKVVHAQTLQESLGLQQIEDVTMLGKEDIRLTIAKIIRIFLGFLGILALGLMLYAGYEIMTSAGDPNKVERGKKILLNTAIGLLIIFASFAIVQFFIMKLSEATNFLGQGSGVGASRQTFLGTGSLGRIVKDHYPFRDQRDVPRNTRISVTFNEAYDPASMFIDRNNGAPNGTFGDCINTASPTFDWNRDCDHVNTSAVQVYELGADGKETGAVLDMVALASDEGGSFFTVVLRPLVPLGNDTDPVGYSVDLTNSILKEIGGGMFASARENHYKWKFYTGTEFDFTPPTVVSVFPFPGEAEARNTIIQINFSEPVDPTVAQGRAGTFYQIILQNKTTNAVPTGSWRISNGYTTVEFVSDQPCGENSCGEPMYCLPSNCTLPTCTEDHDTLVRTAALVAVSSWEAVPFSGVTDMSGNALDGDNDGNRDGKPGVNGGALGILAGEQAADNYLWSFDIENRIDRSAPYIREILPKIDEGDVLPEAENSMLFSKPMWSWTMNGIEIDEKFDPAPPAENVDALWFRPRGQLIVDPITFEKTYLITMSHRVFGPNDQDAYYFTSVSSTVKALNQNCIYPGRGPYSNIQGSAPVCDCNFDANGNLISCTGCINVTGSANPNQDTGCVQTADANQRLQGDVQNCLNVMDTISVF